MKPSKLALLAAVALLTSAALADDIWIKSESVDVRSGKGAIYPVVATVKKGAKLTVLAHEGGWYKVQVGDQQGYVFSAAISDKEVSGSGDILSGLSANTGTTSGAAAKGLEPRANDYAASKNLDPHALDALIAFRNTITPAEWTAFTAAGQVGPDKPQAVAH